MKRTKGNEMALACLAIAAVVLLIGEAVKADFIFGEPTNLGAPINSPSSEFDVCVSADGLELYFGSLRAGGFGGNDIWVVGRATVKAPWAALQNLGSTVNTPYDCTDPSISADGLTLYFRSDRPGGYGRTDLWVTTRLTKDDPWSEPANLGPTVNGPYDEGDPSISADGLSLYFSEWSSPESHPRPGGHGSSDIWVVTRPTIETPWSEPVNVGPGVNGAYNDWHPCVSAHGLALFFASDRSGGLGRDDLYMTTRVTTADPWGEAVHLGPTINTSLWDENPEISADGSILYFDAVRPGGMGELDLWQLPVITLVDFNGDGKVDGSEVSAVADRWGTNDSLCDIGPMPWGDGVVDLEDLKVLAEYIEKPIVDGTLVAHWALDEAEGPVAHDSACDNDGTVAGDPLWCPDGGAVGGALAFGGATFVSADFALNPKEGPFSVLAWVKGGAPGQVILSQEGGTDWLALDPTTGALMSGLHSGSRLSRALYSDAVIADNAWHRVGFTWDGFSRSLYVDDILVAEGDDVGLAECYGGLNIGCGKSAAPDTFFIGLIDDVRIYNRAVRP